MSRLLKTPFSQHGFTLIELMITITVLAFLLFIGSSLTRAWVDRSQVDNGFSSLKNAIFQARSAALRNTNNQPTSYPAATVCYDKTVNKINIVRSAAYATNPCLVSNDNDPSQNYLLQELPLAKDVKLKVSGNDFNCLAFNSAGVIVAAAASSGACSNQSGLVIRIEKNDENTSYAVN